MEGSDGTSGEPEFYLRCLNPEEVKRGGKPDLVIVKVTPLLTRPSESVPTVSFPNVESESPPLNNSSENYNNSESDESQSEVIRTLDTVTSNQTVILKTKPVPKVQKSKRMTRSEKQKISLNSTITRSKFQKNLLFTKTQSFNVNKKEKASSNKCKSSKAKLAQKTLSDNSKIFSPEKTLSDHSEIISPQKTLSDNSEISNTPNEIEENCKSFGRNNLTSQKSKNVEKVFSMPKHLRFRIKPRVCKSTQRKYKCNTCIGLYCTSKTKNLHQKACRIWNNVQKHANLRKVCKNGNVQKDDASINKQAEISVIPNAGNSNQENLLLDAVDLNKETVLSDDVNSNPEYPVFKAIQTNQQSESTIIDMTTDLETDSCENNTVLEIESAESSNLNQFMNHPKVNVKKCKRSQTKKSTSENSSEFTNENGKNVHNYRTRLREKMASVKQLQNKTNPNASESSNNVVPSNMLPDVSCKRLSTSIWTKTINARKPTVTLQRLDASEPLNNKSVKSSDLRIQRSRRKKTVVRKSPICQESSEHQIIHEGRFKGTPYRFRVVSGIPKALTVTYCHYCQIQIPSQHELRIHLQNEHQFKCFTCRMSFPTEMESLIHRINVHTLDQHECIPCDRIFSKLSYYNLHSISQRHYENLRLQERTVQRVLDYFDISFNESNLPPDFVHKPHCHTNLLLSHSNENIRRIAHNLPLLDKVKAVIEKNKFSKNRNELQASRQLNLCGAETEIRSSQENELELQERPQSVASVYSLHVVSPSSNSNSVARTEHVFPSDILMSSDSSELLQTVEDYENSNISKDVYVPQGYVFDSSERIDQSGIVIEQSKEKSVAMILPIIRTINSTNMVNTHLSNTPASGTSYRFPESPKHDANGTVQKTLISSGNYKTSKTPFNLQVRMFPEIPTPVQCPRSSRFLDDVNPSTSSCVPKLLHPDLYTSRTVSSTTTFTKPVSTISCEKPHLDMYTPPSSVPSVWGNGVESVLRMTTPTSSTLNTPSYSRSSSPSSQYTFWNADINTPHFDGHYNMLVSGTSSDLYEKEFNRMWNEFRSNK